MTTSKKKTRTAARARTATDYNRHAPPSRPAAARSLPRCWPGQPRSDGTPTGPTVRRLLCSPRCPDDARSRSQPSHGPDQAGGAFALPLSDRQLVDVADACDGDMPARRGAWAGTEGRRQRLAVPPVARGSEALRPCSAGCRAVEREAPRTAAVADTTEVHARGQPRFDLASLLDACCSRTDDDVASSCCDDATRDSLPPDSHASVARPRRRSKHRTKRSVPERPR